MFPIELGEMKAEKRRELLGGKGGNESLTELLVHVIATV